MPVRVPGSSGGVNGTPRDDDGKRGVSLEKRKVTVSIGGRVYRFYSDDSDAYIATLEQRANAALKQTAGFSGASVLTNAVLAVLLLTDELMRTEQKAPGDGGSPEVRETAKEKKKKPAEKDDGQVSVWDLLEEQEGKAPSSAALNKAEKAAPIPS